jgi:hypothetical protein
LGLVALGLLVLSLLAVAVGAALNLLGRAGRDLAPEPRQSSSDWMSSRRPPKSSRAPEAISSSIAPARACIWAVLSSARWMAMPTSPISSEMPENASLMRVCASAAV